MFDSKQKTLGTAPKKKASVPSSASGNRFLTATMKKSAETVSGNGALKYSETDDEFVTEFGQAGNWKAPRSFDDVASSMSMLWSISALLCVKFVLFLRLITRIVQLPGGTKTTVPQRGQGLRHEAILRMMWLGIWHPAAFQKNIKIYIACGSWRDIFYMLQYDLIHHRWHGRVLDWDFLGKVILSGLENEESSELVKKWLPSIKSNGKCTTVESEADNLIGKWLCSMLFGTKGETSGSTYKQYRKLKSSGTAHSWQQLISRGKMIEINFDTIAGRALAQLVSGKFIANAGLEKQYTTWIESKPVAKFTGYVHELFLPYLSQIGYSSSNLNVTTYQAMTINKQFAGLVETAKKGASQATSFIVVRDTSGSMGSPANGVEMSCGDVAKSLALFFSQMLPEGAFAGHWIEFCDGALMRKWHGSTPVEMWNNDHASYIGGTNFQSVITLFCQMKSKGIAESEFPTGIVCISDGEFNKSDLGKSNVHSALGNLRTAGFSEEYVSNFAIVLWNLKNNYYLDSSTKFETYGSRGSNVFYFCGYDASVIAFLTGVEGKEATQPKNAKELFDAAMDQEVLQMVEV